MDVKQIKLRKIVRNFIIVCRRVNKDWAGKPLDLAQEIASKINAPDDVYVMDICDSDDGNKLLKLNPFSGADLYNCDRSLIVDAMTKLLTV